jgi:hypothetical protein
MGLNAFFTYTLVIGQGIPWPVALGIVVWSGMLFLAASLTPLRTHIARAIPESLRIAAAASIGLLPTSAARCSGPAHLLHHSGYSLGVHPARPAAPAGGTRP